MKLRTIILFAAAVAVASCSVSCQGLTLSVSPSGEISASYTIPPKGVIISDKGSK